MPDPLHPQSSVGGIDPVLDDLVEELTQKLHAGERVDASGRGGPGASVVNHRGYSWKERLMVHVTDDEAVIRIVDEGQVCPPLREERSAADGAGSFHQRAARSCRSWHAA